MNNVMVRSHAVCLAALASTAVSCGRDLLARRLPGESCQGGAACAAGTMCFEGTCRPVEGGACDGERLRCVPDLTCQEGKCAAVNAPPTLSFVTPAELGWVRGTITVAVEAQDADGIREVRLIAGDAAPFATIASAPYQAPLDTTASTDGPLALAAEAVDNRGLVSRIARALNVDNSPPVIRDLAVDPWPAYWGQTLSITFKSSEPLARARVTVGGRAAAPASQEGLHYGFAYPVGRDDPTTPLVRAEGDDLAGGSGSTEVSFAVSASCAPGFQDCDTELTTVCETELGTLLHCSGCGDACSVAPLNGDPACGGSACDFACRAGFHRCGQSCEGNSDPLHCGGGCQLCPVPGHGTAICQTGSCTIACDGGFHPCSGACDANTSVDSCGASCDPCPVPADAEATCDGSSCGFSCQPGFCKVGSACVDVLSDMGNCGSCGHACAGGQTCIAGACSPPVADGETFFGGTGNEYGTGAAYAGGAVFFSAHSGATAEPPLYQVASAFAGRFNPTPSGFTLAWSHQWPDEAPYRASFNGVAAGPDGIYVVGVRNWLLTPGSLDVCKTVVLKYPFSFASFPSPTWFSWWSALGGFEAGQWLAGVAAVQDGSSTYVVAVGRSHDPNLLAAGSLLMKVKDPVSAGPIDGKTNTENRAPLQSGWPQFMTNTTYSWGWGVAILAGHAYAVGMDNTNSPFIAKYDLAGAQKWLKRGTTEFGFTGEYRAVVAHDGALYAAGSRTNSPGSTYLYLVDKWAPDGTRLWRKTYVHGSAAYGTLRGAVGIGSRLYAVGNYSAVSPGVVSDAITLEIDTETGGLYSTTLYGDAALDDTASAVTTDGTSLFVVGATKSYGAGGYDVMVLRYRR